MTEPPDQPPTLDYRSPEPRGLGTGVQAFLGALVTLVLVTAITIIMGFVTADLKNHSETIFVFVVVGLVVFGGLLNLAWHLRDNPDRRGWAIGIFIGLALGGLFFGYCGVVMSNGLNI